MIFHEAFGTLPDGSPMTVDTPTWMASITKLLTGVLLMQFVDQG
ncbi:1,4-butanediol diacrylate esterase, partial [candidate division KSB1 bacterium]